MAVNFGQLQSTLLMSGLQTSNPSLYQVIEQLISASGQLQDNTVTSINDVIDNLPHDLLDADIDQDTVLHTVVAGDLIFGNSTPKWDALAINPGLLYSVGGVISWSQHPAAIDFTGHLIGNADTATKWITARNLAGNSVDGSANVAFANKFIVQGIADSGLSGPQFLGALGTGIIKNTTTSGILSIAVAADFPTLNQNTTGSAGSLNPGKTISITGDLAYTSPVFDGTANITAVGTLATVATAGTSGGSTAIPVITINAKGLVTTITTAAVIAPAGTLTGTTLASNVVTSSLTTVGTLATGVWQATKIGLAYGGTNADLSATGGTKQYLKQASSGAAITVGTIPASDIGSGAALTEVDDTNVTLTLGGTPTSAVLAATSLTLGWTGLLGLSRGGTNINLSATGGASQVLKQNASHVISVAQLASSDLSDTANIALLDAANVFTGVNRFSGATLQFNPLANVNITGANLTNGLTFGTNIISVDFADGRVGIGNTAPSTILDVTGTITATTLSSAHLSGGASTLLLDTSALHSHTFTGSSASGMWTQWKNGTTEIAEIGSANQVIAGGTLSSDFGIVGSTNLYLGTAGNIAFYTNTTKNGTMFASGGFAWGNTTDPGSKNLGLAGKFVNYNNITTSGWGLPAIYEASPRYTGVAASATSLLATWAYTVGASDGSFLVSANVLVNSSAGINFNVNCVYTDDGGTSRTLVLNFSTAAGAFVTAITGAGAYEGIPLQIRAKTGTSISFTTSATTYPNYNIDCVAIQIS